eukprot:m.113544 g.113544  ORF g.113544 m.113544 type:complete len:93 (-) comp19318_c1_seq2:66-344(-)
MGRILVRYEGATQSKHRCQTTFNHNDECVVSSSESINSVTCWDTRSGSKQKSFIGHQDNIRWVEHSQTLPLMVSCGMDMRVRVWRAKGTSFP